MCRVMAWLQDKAAIAFTRMQDMQQKVRCGPLAHKVSAACWCASMQQLIVLCWGCRPTAGSSSRPKMRISLDPVRSGLQHPQQRGARRTADGYYGGNGQGSSPSTPSTDNIWTSSRRTAEAAMNAFSRTKHD